MLEEFTGTWCGWCTRGFYALEALNELYGDAVVLAAYHDSDPMQVTSELPVEIDGFPSSTLNRKGVEDPYYGRAGSGFGMKHEVYKSMEAYAPADIQVNAYWGNVDKTEIKVESCATFLEDKKDAGYTIGYLLINNGLSGDTKEWLQSNYFAGKSEYAGTDLEVLTTWPSKVKGLVFNDVVVDVDGMMGVPNSLPSDISFNQPYASEFSYDIALNEVIQNKEMLYVAAFIINPDGTILNANKAKVSGSSAANAFEAEVKEESAEYYTLSGARVNNPEKGVFVKLSRMSDGSFRTAKIIR